MKFKLKYCDLYTRQPKVIEFEALTDVCSVEIPPQTGEQTGGNPRPGLIVNVNSDAVAVDAENNTQLWFLEYDDMIADAEADGYDVFATTNHRRLDGPLEF